MKSLGIWRGHKLVGTLVQDKQGDLAFAYDETWLSNENRHSISVSLPLHSGTYSHKACFPFFDGLLPEAAQRKAVAKALGLSPNNAYSLLDAIGGEVAGDLEFLPSGQEPESWDKSADPKPLDEAALAAVLDKLPVRPMLAGEDGLRLSLAGAKSKLPVVVVNGGVALPLKGQPTSHILKPTIPGLPGSTENEAFSMRLAATLGLNTAPVEQRSVHGEDGKKRSFILVERYDRTTKHGYIERLHQEDFCQAMGIPSTLKYQSEGGPNVKTSFSLVRNESKLPGADIKHLMDAMIFNAIIGNADAHGKNFSLLYTEEGPRLAPLYDLMSTAFYPTLAKKFAMKIGDQAQFERLGPRAWQLFAADAGVTNVIVKKRITAITQKVPSGIDNVVAGMDPAKTDMQVIHDLATFLKDRAASMLQKTFADVAST